MKILDTSNITTTVGMPVKKGVLDHVQQSYQELIKYLAQQFVGLQYDSTKVYVLIGVAASNLGTLYSITAGAIYYNGEIFLVDSTGFTISGGQVPVINLVTTYATSSAGDPVQHTDGSSHNVLQIRKATVIAGTTGTGNLTGTTASDLSNAIICNSPTPKRTVSTTMPSVITATFNQDGIDFFQTGIPNSASFSINFDFTGAIPGTVRSFKFAAGSGITFTITGGSGIQIINESGAVTSSKTNYLYLMYMGINEAGNQEIRYKVVSI